MIVIYIFIVIVSLLFSYYLVYLAVKTALSEELKKTNELLTKLISDKKEVNDALLKGKVNDKA